MSWHVTLVHGNEDVWEMVARDFPEALTRAGEVEREICGSSEDDPFASMKEVFRGGDIDKGYLQFGTNYHYVKFVGCICTKICPEDYTENDCPYCKRLDIYEPCPIVGFGCGDGCDCCTPEQQKAADS